MPEKYKAEDLLAEMKQQVQKGERVFLPRAKEARNILPEGIEAMGAHCVVAEAYMTTPDLEYKDQLLSLLTHHEVDIITFTSSSTVHNLMKLLDGKNELLEGVALACIGPITADTCRSYGLVPHIVSDVYTIDGLVEAIEKNPEKY